MFHTLLLSDDSYLFVIGGASGGEGGTRAFDLLSINTDGGPEESCSGRFPTRLWGAVGVTLGMPSYFLVQRISDIMTTSGQFTRCK